MAQWGDEWDDIDDEGWETVELPKAAYVDGSPAAPLPSPALAATDPGAAANLFASFDPFGSGAGAGASPPVLPPKPSATAAAAPLDTNLFTAPAEPKPAGTIGGGAAWADFGASPAGDSLF